MIVFKRNSVMIVFKRNSVCIIILLSLLYKNKDIVNIIKSNICINFNQTIMKIYFDSSNVGIIPIIFE
jgi:hypothetical protein